MADAAVPDRLVFCLRRRPELSREEFHTYWRERHAPLVAERAPVLGIVRYRQMHTLLGDAYDGIAELHTDRTTRSADRDAVMEAGQRLLDDEREFIDLERSPIWNATEDVITAGPELNLRVTAVCPVPADLALLRRRLEDAEPGRRSTLLLAPTDAGPNPLALARRSPEPHPCLVETWLGDDADTAAAIDELAGHLSAAGADPDSQLVWVARSHRIVEPS